MNFDDNWKYCYQDKSKNIDDIISTIWKQNDCWSPVTLPHTISIDTNLYNCWYRNIFNENSSKPKSQEKVYLLFQSESMNLSGSLWMNGEHIPLEDEKIEITKYLIEDKNVLIICSENQSLSAHISIIIQRNTQEDKNELDFTVQLDDQNGRFDLRFDDSRSSLPSLNIDTSNQVASNHDENVSVPYLSIVILIVGTRGDVQPFVALGKSLVEYGHRVRLATHESFRSFVRENGLEFYPLAGDPSELMSFMVKNAGIIPSLSSIVAGDIGKHRQILFDILKSTWLACTADDDETLLPFTAEAIIANPPSFGHIHCAEKLQIPLHIMFTMPWSPTTAFPHPLCNIDYSIGSKEKLNYYSYQTFEMIVWSGMRNIINNFRKKTLGLSSLPTRKARNLLIDQRVPHTYCWSTALVPKPADWDSHIDVSGFFFLNLSNTYTNPPEDLVHFLGVNNNNNKMSPPIYIGFGSITGHDSRRLLQVVIDALEQTGYRAVLSGLATAEDALPETIFKISNVPHDWLFQYVSAVCHHGGAGTTAAGLRAGKPTIIVPFFGDQFFWGNVIKKSGAGPRPLPGKSITADELAYAFRFAHQPSTCAAAEKIQLAMEKENGCEAAVRSFHSHLPLDRMRSDLDATYAACYRIDKLNIQISRPVAHVLVSAGAIDISDLRSQYTRKWKLRRKHFRRHSQSIENDFSNLKTNSIGSLLSDECESTFNDSNSEDSFGSSDSSIKSRTRLLWHNRKIASLYLLRRPQSGNEHHDIKTTNIAKALINTSNCAIQSTMSSFPITPGLDIATIDTAQKTVCESENQTLSSLVPTIGIYSNAKIASLISGLPLNTTEEILRQFEKIQTSTSSLYQTEHRSELQQEGSHSNSVVEAIF